MSTKNYLLLIDVTEDYDTHKLAKKLDLCLDWLRIVPGCYFLHSKSDKEKLYTRFKSVLEDTCFFITEISNEHDYTGWLSKSKWEWISKYKL